MGKESPGTVSLAASEWPKARTPAELFISEKAFRVEGSSVDAEDVFVEMQLSEGNEDFRTDAEILATDGNRLEDITDGG